MRQKRCKPGKWHLPAVTLFCLIVQVNAAQGVVLCFGARGHVAIEPAGHRHCDGMIHDHAHATEPIHEGLQHFTPEPCDPCVDIPLPFAPLEEKPSVHMPKVVGASVAGELPAVNSNLAAVPATFQDGFLPPLRAPLRTVVLQV